MTDADASADACLIICNDVDCTLIEHNTIYLDLVALNFIWGPIIPLICVFENSVSDQHGTF